MENNEAVLHEIHDFLGKKRRVHVIMHPQADVDALASAYAVAVAYDGDIICSSMSKTAAAVAEKFGIEVKSAVEAAAKIEKSDAIVIVDTSYPESLGVSGVELKHNVVVIDHHAKRSNFGKYNVTYYYCDESASSCAEIVYDLLRAGGKTVPQSVVVLILAGMIADTAQFRHANIASMQKFVTICDAHKIEPKHVFSVFEQQDTPRALRIAVLKAAQRMRFEEYHGLIIAASTVGAYEGKTATALLSLGVDVAFVGSEEGGKFRISGRCAEAATEAGLHLGRLMQIVADRFKHVSWLGGGHEGAAGITGTGDVEFALNVLVTEAKKMIRQQRLENQQ